MEKEKNKHVQVDRREFEKVYRTAGTSTLIDLEIDGETSPVLIKEVQPIHLKINIYM